MQDSASNMDIRKWLAETEQSAPSELADMEPFLLPGQPSTVPDARRRRKRSSSDSSLLKAPSPQIQSKGASRIKQDRRNVQYTENKTRSDISHCTSNKFTSDSTANQRYARRPRRKTRPDRYEAGSRKVKEQDKHPHPSRKSHSRKPRRKSKRGKDDKTHSGMGQDFHAKNVSKDRLTLKPVEKMGLFSKGRTSTSIKGRGLPDLVFSEMKFLRKDKHSNESGAQVAGAKKKRKRDHARTKEEDISAFFTAVRPALAETYRNVQAKDAHQTRGISAAKADYYERVQERPAMLDNVIPTIESEDKTSHLGFGSRGARHESTSYFSWSESVRVPSATPGQRSKAPSVYEKLLDLTKRKTKNERCGDNASTQQRASSSVVHEATVDVAERIGMSSVAPMASRFSRSQSLPQPSSSPRRPNHVDQALSRQTTKNATSPSSMPAALPRYVSVEPRQLLIPDNPRSTRSLVTSYVSETAAPAPKWNIAGMGRATEARKSRRESSSLGGVLQNCNNISQAQRQTAVSPRGYNIEAPLSPEVDDTVGQARRRRYMLTGQIPAIRFLPANARPSGQPNFSGPGFYAQQEQRQHVPVPVDVGEVCMVQRMGFGGEDCNISERDFMGLEDFEGASEEPVHGMVEDVEGDVAGAACYIADDVEQTWERAGSKGVSAGFWRPNKLY